MEFSFTLTYKLHQSDCDAEVIARRIYDTGCDFGLGTGKPGWLGALCTVDAESMGDAVHLATTALGRCIPSAMLVKMEADEEHTRTQLAA